MSNMSYCRFENTLGDLRDCLRNLNARVGSRSEDDARDQLVQVCREIASKYRVADNDSRPRVTGEEDEDL